MIITPYSTEIPYTFNRSNMLKQLNIHDQRKII
jgi:hypothetical protein